jgi:preprotein translocase subunit SecD
MRQRFISAVVILLIVSLAGCSFPRPTSPLTWHLLLEIDAAASDREAAVNRTVGVIEQRLDGFGLSRFSVLPQGSLANGRILVSLPNVPDRGRLKKLITSGGLLEFTAVVSPPSPAPVTTYDTQAEAANSLAGKPPGQRRVLPYVERSEADTYTDANASGTPKKWVVVQVPAIVDGSELRTATAVQSRTDSEDYQIAFSLKQEGAEKFRSWTGEHINDYLGVVLNGEVKSIAFIKSQIFDQGEISGRFTKQSAEDLALILRSGALPAPLKIIEEGDNK